MNKSTIEETLEIRAEKSTLEKAIEIRAKRRFQKEVEKAKKAIADSLILNRLEFNGERRLKNFLHYEPYRKETNYKAVKSNLMDEYISEETTKLLSQVDVLTKFIEERE